MDKVVLSDGHRELKAEPENDHSVRIAVKPVHSNKAEVIYLNGEQIKELIDFLKPFVKVK